MNRFQRSWGTSSVQSIGGGENRTLVLRKLHINYYMLSPLLINPSCCRVRHLRWAGFIYSREDALEAARRQLTPSNLTAVPKPLVKFWAAGLLSLLGLSSGCC